MQALFREPLTLDDAARAKLPGEFVRLEDGTTHYEIAGPEDGPPVVLVHGFSTPLFIWDPIFQPLAEAGFRVLRYDLYGRGYSDRPRVRYDEELFDRQLLHLLDALEIDAAHLVGLSMGGPVTALFTARHPERARRLALIDPAGYELNPTLAALLLFIPGIGELLMALAGNRVLVDGLANDFHHPEDFIEEYAAKYQAQLPYRGFKRAILSTMRSIKTLQNADAIYRAVGEQERDVLLLWGREDRVIPVRISEQVHAAIPGLEFHAIDCAGHLPHYERTEETLPILLEFLGRG